MWMWRVRGGSWCRTGTTDVVDSRRSDGRGGVRRWRTGTTEPDGRWRRGVRGGSRGGPARTEGDGGGTGGEREGAGCGKETHDGGETRRQTAQEGERRVTTE